MRVDVLRDVGIAAEAAHPTRTAAQLLGLESLRVNFTDINSLPHKPPAS
jgi:hypothetical protein